MNVAVIVCCAAGAVFVSQSALGTNIFNKKNEVSVENSGNPRGSSSLNDAPQAQEERLSKTIQVITQQNTTNLTRSMISITSVALIVYVAYSYYSNNSNTKQVIDKIDGTTKDQKELVKECDDNADRRNEELDERIEKRISELSAEMRGEQRAHFEILSKQLNCVTQVCLQTIGALANPSEDGEEHAKQNEQLVLYAEKTQEICDNLFDRETYLKAMDTHLAECRHQISALKKNEMKIEIKTRPKTDISDGTMKPLKAMGSRTNETDDNVGLNSVGSESTNQFVRKLSAPGMTDSRTSKNKPKSLMEWNFIKFLKLSHFSEYFVVRFVDPVYFFMSEHKKAVAGCTLGLGLISLSVGYDKFFHKSKKNKETVKLI